MQFVKAFNFFGVKTRQIPNIPGAGAPTTATKGEVGCQYMDTNTGKLYKCIAVNGSSYTWVAIGGGSGGSLSASIVDNVLEVTLAGGLSANIQNGVLVVA